MTRLVGKSYRRQQAGLMNGLLSADEVRAILFSGNVEARLNFLQYFG